MSFQMDSELVLHRVPQQNMAARSLRDRLRALFNGRPAGRIIDYSTSSASLTAATAIFPVLRPTRVQ